LHDRHDRTLAEHAMVEHSDLVSVVPERPLAVVAASAKLRPRPEPPGPGAEPEVGLPIFVDALDENIRGGPGCPASRSVRSLAP
jgi:hypothetical protein